MYFEFNKWLDSLCDENGSFPGKAINFNLYEGENDFWYIQMISVPYYDEENDDWCCDELFSSGYNEFKWQHKCNWEEAQNEAEQLIKHYLDNGNNKDLLMNYDAITVGFVDGDLTLIYKKF